MIDTDYIELAYVVQQRVLLKRMMDDQLLYERKVDDRLKALHSEFMEREKKVREGIR